MHASSCANKKNNVFKAIHPSRYENRMKDSERECIIWDEIKQSQLSNTYSIRDLGIVREPVRDTFLI